jgi:hypothetical protein
LLPAPSGHYPGRIFPVKRMLPVKAILVAAPLLLGGAGGAWHAHGRVGALRAELAAVDARGKAEGDSYLRTLQGAHAERHLDLLTRRHDVAMRLAVARRDRLLGVIAVLGGALAFAFVRVAQRIGAEVEEGRRLTGARPAGGTDPRAPKEPSAS